MQYILTKDEFDTLNKPPLIDISRKQLQALCTKICNEMPVKWVGWPNHTEPTPWSCKLDDEYEWYCDNCPVQTICPSDDKEYSK